MKVIEVDFEKCSGGCEGWDDECGGCPMLPCRDIVKDGIVIIKVKGVEPPTDEELAQAFHEAYEKLAPSFGYKTRDASAKPWSEVPEDNKKLMIATVHEVREGASPWG